MLPRGLDSKELQPGFQTVQSGHWILELAIDAEGIVVLEPVLEQVQWIIYTCKKRDIRDSS